MLGAGSGALASELFADDEHVHVLDKAGVYTDVFGSDAPVLLGAFSDDAEECPGCGPVHVNMPSIPSSQVPVFCFDATNTLTRSTSLNL